MPFGLVRYGVAPDHLSIRSVRDTLDKTLDKPGVRFLGNVTIGQDLSVADLHTVYDAVIFTYGASRDRRLGVEGEDLDGSVAATDFVAWYCGHPDADRELFERLIPTSTSAVVVGVGNVAVDVARVLGKSVPELDHTDMPQHVFDTLARSGITDVYVLGRRGPAQAAWTTKELKELGELAEADVIVRPEDAVLDEASAALAASDRAVGRNVDVIREWSQRVPEGKPRRVHLRFLSRPVELKGDDRVRTVVVERTRLTAEGGAEGTGRARGGRGRPGRAISRLPGDSAGRGAVRRRTQRDPPCRRPRAARRRHGCGGVRGRLDQARPHGDHRHQQEGRGGDRGVAARRRGARPAPRARRRRRRRLSTPCSRRGASTWSRLRAGVPSTPPSGSWVRPGVEIARRSTTATH